MYEGNPQLEDGFTRIANELLDAVLRAPFAASEQRVLLAVIRLTYGYNRKEDTISYSQVASLTELDRRVVIRAMNSLLKRRVLMRQDKGPRKPAVWAVQKRYESWNLASDNQNTRPPSDTRNTSASDNRDTSASDNAVTHQRQLKTERQGDISPRKRSERTPLPPAVKAYQQAAERNPRKSLYGMIVDAVGEDPAEVERWGKTVLAYVAQGWNPTNIGNMLAYFERGEMPGTTPTRFSGNGSHADETVEEAAARLWGTP